MSASRSKEYGDEYADDHSQLVPPGDDYGARNGSGRSSSRPMQAPVQNEPQRRQPSVMPTRISSGPSSIGGAPRTASYDSDRESSSSGGGGGGGGGGTNAELSKRVVMLEEQIRLLKQQNRIFLSFMQNTEQQLAELRAAQQDQQAAAPVEPPRSRSRLDQAAPTSAGYPNNMSQATKQVLQRSASERQTQPPPSSGTSRPAPAASHQSSSSGDGGYSSFGGGGDFDQTFAPLESDADRRERDRMKSAKKKAGLLNLREKMAQKERAAAAQQQAPPPATNRQEDSRGRGYQAQAYQDQEDPHSGGYGYASHGGGSGGYQQQPSARQQPAQQLPRSAAAQRAPPVSSRAPPPASDPYDDDYGGGGGGGGFGGGGNDSFNDGGIPPGADEVLPTFPCPNCDRRFNQVALAKHVAKQLCKQKPRKVFNMAQKRLEDLASEAREAGIKLPTKPAPASAAAAATQKTTRGEQPLKKQSKWRVEHEKFMNAIQAGKQLQAAVASGIPLSSLPPPPATREEDDDRTPCPHWSEGEEERERVW